MTEIRFKTPDPRMFPPEEMSAYRKACNALPEAKASHAALTPPLRPVNSFHKQDADEETILRSVTMGEELQ